jgi:hypothetical protein
MIDALLLGVRDAIRNPSGPFDYGKQSCDIRADGQPPPKAGAWFVSIHQLSERNTGINRLDEYFAYAITLTGRVVNAPLDRIGDVMLAKLYAEQTGFNRRMRRLRMFLAENWDIIQLANNYLVEMVVDAEIVYGFCEAGKPAEVEVPVLVDGSWFDADPKSANVGLKAQASFIEIRRIQAIGTFT